MKKQVQPQKESKIKGAKIPKSASVSVRRGSTEEALRREEQKYRDLVENANSIIMEMDSKGRITFINHYAQKFFGYSAEEITGKDVRILVPALESSGRDLVAMANEILQRPDEFVDNINENVRKDGTRVWISWRNKAIRDARGRIVGNLAVGQDITPLKCAEEALRASESRFRSLYESSVDGMLITMPDGSILSANPKMCELLGMTEEEIVHAGREGIVVKDEKLAAALVERTRTGQFHGDLTFRRKDGTFMQAEISSIIFKDFDGTLKTGQVVRDITERKRTEEALKRAYAEMERQFDQRTTDLKRLADLLDVSYDAIIVRDEEVKILYWNEGARETYGWSREEALGRSCFELLRTQFPLPLPEIMGQLTREGRWEGELTHTCKNGDQIVVLSRWVLNKTGSGTHDEVLEVNRNISIRKARERALNKASAYNRSLIEASLDPLVTIGPDGKITDVNTATEVVTGYSRKELVGTDFSGYFIDLKKATNGYKRVFEQGFVRDYELEIRHRTGHVTPVLYNATVYKDDSGQVAGVLAAARDISERKRMDEELHLHGQILSNMIEGVNLIRADDLTIAYANPRLEAMFEYGQGELIGKHISVLNASSETDSLEMVKGIIDCINRTGFWQGEVKNIKKSGQEFWCYAKVSRIKHAQYGDAYISVQSDITERKRADEELFGKTKALEELNTALKVLINHYKNDQREFEGKIMFNINLRIDPYLEKLRRTRLDAGQSALLEVIARSLQDIFSPFLKGVSKEQYRFTPNELEVISLIKEGKTTKDIARLLNKGVRTVDSCRDNIRHKLGIAKEKVNLRTYLISTLNTDNISEK